MGNKRRIRDSESDMRSFMIFFGIVTLAFLASCADAAKPPVRVESPPPANAAAAEHDDHGEAAAPRISLADAKKDYDDADAVIIDVRNEEAYKQEHIKGAINLSKGIQDEQLNKIPKGKKIIAYCS